MKVLIGVGTGIVSLMFASFYRQAGMPVPAVLIATWVTWLVLFLIVDALAGGTE